MKIFTSNDEEYIISQYISGIALGTIAKEYNCHWNTCKKVLVKNNIYIRNCKDVGNNKRLKLSKSEEQNIIKLYNSGCGVRKISNITNHGTKNISAALVKNKIEFRKPNKKHIFDDHIFDLIDTEEKAYWIGMLLSDGCVYNNRYTLCLALSKNDINHLIKFKKFLKTSCNISDAGQDVLRLTINSKYLINTIKKYGLIPNKTFNENIFGMPEQYERDFWRGMIDGDGWIFRNNYKREWYVGLCGSYEIVEKFSEYISNIFDIKIKEPLKANSIFKIQYSGTHLPRKIIDHFYSNSRIYLDRKMIKAKEIMKEIL